MLPTGSSHDTEPDDDGNGDVENENGFNYCFPPEVIHYFTVIHLSKS